MNLSLLQSLATPDQRQALTGKWVVAYFYPKDNTPGCTTQATEFSGLLPEFERLGATVVGISRDPQSSHERFREKYDLQHLLLSDTEEKACQGFEVIREKNMYGKKVMGIERSTFLFNPAGQLVQEWRKIKAAGHAQAVLDTLQARTLTG